MEWIREWATGLCVAGLACAALHLLCPSGALQRMFKMLTAVFFSLCLFAPLSNIPQIFQGVSLDTSQSETQDRLSQTVCRQITDCVNEHLTSEVRALAAPYGITVKKAEINRDSLRDDNIYIEQITVTVDKQDAPVDDTLRRVLENALQTNVEVRYEE